jgi:type IX secretion system PorP/SprF family membrane protein
MREIVVIIIALCLGKSCHAQYFQFSQYNFTPQRINPALVASTNYALLSFDYRNQATDGGFHLTSNIMNASYPFITKAGRRWSGVGISLMDDRSGQAGIFNTQEAALSYAVSVPITRWQSISVGMKALYQNWKIDLNGLSTGAQYVPDRGFDESVSNGESVDQLRNNFFTLSAGIYWQEVDRKGNKLSYWGFSFFDFNKPEDSFLGSTSQLNSTFSGMAGVRIYSKGNITVFPEVLYTRTASRNVLNAGFVTGYEIRPYPNQVSARIDLITKYVIGRSGIIGVQVHRENLAVGVSYDFPVIKRNVANVGTFELGLQLKRLVDPKKKRKTVARKPAPAPASTAKNPANKSVVKKDSVTTAMDSVRRKVPVVVQDDLSARLKQKQDSLKAAAMAGQITHEPLVLERATLHFNFEFNSIDLDEEATLYLDDLARALRDNPELNVKLVGHTDNVGSEKFNLKLSLYRAQTMRDYLIEKGIAENRVVAEGRGMKEPLNENKSEEDRAKNRRVEMTILYEE